MLVMRLEFWTGSRLTTGWLDPDDFTVKLYLGSPGKDDRRVPRSIYSLAHILDWILSGTLLESGTEIKVWILSGLWSVSGLLVMEVEGKVQQGRMSVLALEELSLQTSGFQVQPKK